MSGDAEPIADRVSAAPARTVAAGTARLSSWWACSPLPGEQVKRCEGVADFAPRRTRVSQVLVPQPMADGLLAGEDNDAALRSLTEPRDMIYDGANAFIRVADRWTAFFLVDPGGPRGINDPLWPLDALFGASDQAVAIGPDTVRGVATTRCRLTVDLARADAAVPAGVSVPAGPYRALHRLPAEVWLDAAGLVRRLSVSSELTAAPADMSWAIVELWDFGVAVDITPPGPDEIRAPRDVDWETPGSAA
jgi:hypothetical protein